jgi:peroxiredoxin
MYPQRDIFNSMLQAVKTPQRTDPPPHAGELEELVVQDHRGDDVRLGDLWREQPAVVAFLRHFGCVFCRAQAVQLHHNRERFAASGARLVLVGQGTPDDAKRFRRVQSVDVDVYSDPSRHTYEAAGAKQATFSELINPKTVARGLKHTVSSRLRQGSIAVHQGRIVDNPAQLGGVLVIAPDGSIRYAHMSQDASDVPPVNEVLAAVRAIRPHAPLTG